MRARRHRGATLVETLTAAFISVLTLFTAVSVMISTMGSWAVGQGRIDAESDAQNAVRTIAIELREAMAVTVESGTALSYRLPVRDSEGSYVVPAQWDGVTRRMEWISTGSGVGTVRVTDGSRTRILCRNVILRDPQSSGFTPTSGGSAYAIFTPGAGAITRQLTIMVVSRTSSNRGGWVLGRSRETIFLRNIPTLTR